MKKFLEFIGALAPFLEPYPVWVKVLISGWVILTAVIILSLVFARSRDGIVAINKRDTHPNHLESLTFLTSDSQESLRGITGVRELQPLENDLDIKRLPNGVYGFTVPWIINTNSTGVVGGTGFDRISLQKSGGGTAVMEIHKAEAGDIYVVGYVSESDLMRLIDPSRRTELEVMLFFEAFREFARPVAIPASRIQRSTNRSVEGRYVNDLLVR